MFVNYLFYLTLSTLVEIILLSSKLRHCTASECTSSLRQDVWSGAPGETDGGTVLLSDGLNGCERCGINVHIPQ